SAYAMAFGTTNLIKEDKVYVNKLPDDNRYKGMFIVQGTGTIENKEVIRVPFMNDEDFQDMVLNEWENNPHADYKLHYEEGNEVEEKEIVSEEFSDYEIVEDIVINEDKESSADNRNIDLWDFM
ncbi:MAG: hypothetical protein SA378_09260, partial [Sedimentibacter sp.]|uniref:hypothetical protein n=1 Tax=Sedimentibacter sp. TaxID=1960295 RepID=UPI0029813C68